MRTRILIAVVSMLCALLLVAQQPAPAPSTDSKPAASAPAPAANSGDEAKVTESGGEKLVVPQGKGEDRKIPTGAKVYVAPMAAGFDTYVIAGLQNKKVPVTIVMDRDKADFEISGVAESEKAGWAKMLFQGSSASKEQASVKLVNLKTGTVIFAYSVHKGNSVRGRQSAGEACAKHIKEFMEGRSEGTRLGS